MMTCERQYIQMCFKQGFQICSKTREVLDSTTLIPNFLVQEMIEEWCQNRGVEIREPNQDGILDVLTNVGKDYLNGLIKKISSSSLEDQKEAAKAFRAITEKSSPFCALFSESAADTISKLLSPLSSYQIESRPELVEDHPDLVEDVITTLRNVSMHPNNKILVGGNPLAINLLVRFLNSKNTVTRSNAAAALFTLSEVESNKLIIGESGAIDPLLTLLQHDRLMIAASALLEICTVPENMERAVYHGAVGIILQHIREGVMVSVLLKLLALLTESTMAIEDIVTYIGLRNLIKSIKNMESKLDKEILIGILYKVCTTSQRSLEAFNEEEMNHSIFLRIVTSGPEFSERAKEYASGIIDTLARYGQPSDPEIQPA